MSTQRRSSQRLVAVSGTSTRVEVAAEVVARLTQQIISTRVAERLGPLPAEALQPVLDLFNEGAARARQQLAVLVRAYVEEMHARYAAALHAIRPGLELARAAPPLSHVLMRLEAAGYEADIEEIASLCRTLGLDVVEPGE